MEESRIVAISHVELDASAGLADSLHWFYGQVCQLDGVSTDGGDLEACFRSARIQLRFLRVSTPSVDSIALRVTIMVASLPEVMEQLTEAGVVYESVAGFFHSDRRIELCDPVGHRVSLKQMSSLSPV